MNAPQSVFESWIPTPPISSTVFHQNEKWSNWPKNYINRKVLRCLIEFVWLTRPFFFLFVLNYVSKFGICHIFCHFPAKKLKWLKFRRMRKSLRDVCLKRLIMRWNLNEPYFHARKVKVQKKSKISLKKITKFYIYLSFCHWKQKWLMFRCPVHSLLDLCLGHMVVRSTRKWINIQARQALQNRLCFKKAQSLHFVIISLWSENGSCLDTQHTSTSW